MSDGLTWHRGDEVGGDCAYRIKLSRDPVGDDVFDCSWASLVAKDAKNIGPASVGSLGPVIHHYWEE
jgi:hypothetical protein